MTRHFQLNEWETEAGNLGNIVKSCTAASLDVTPTKEGVMLNELFTVSPKTLHYDANGWSKIKLMSGHILKVRLLSLLLS